MNEHEARTMRTIHSSRWRRAFAGSLHFVEPRLRANQRTPIFPASRRLVSSSSVRFRVVRSVHPHLMTSPGTSDIIASMPFPVVSLSYASVGTFLCTHCGVVDLRLGRPFPSRPSLILTRLLLCCHLQLVPVVPCLAGLAALAEHSVAAVWYTCKSQ